jgi:hypothetical protein
VLLQQVLHASICCDQGQGYGVHCIVSMLVSNNAPHEVYGTSESRRNVDYFTRQHDSCVSIIMYNPSHWYGQLRHWSRSAQESRVGTEKGEGYRRWR